MDELLLNPAAMDSLGQYMISIFKGSTSQNKKEEKKKVSIGGTSRNLYNELSAASDQFAADPMEIQNQTYLKSNVGHKKIYYDCLIREGIVMFKDKPIASKQLHEEKVSCDVIHTNKT